MAILCALALLVGFEESPADKLIEELGKLGENPGAAKVEEYIHPDEGLTVDVALEGAAKPDWKKVTPASCKDDYAKVLEPVFRSGVFKGGRYCAKEGEVYRCTLMSPTSLPRVVELKEAKDKKLKLVRIYWQSADEKEEDQDPEDEELPM